jgi:hypothetical protein
MYSDGQAPTGGESIRNTQYLLFTHRRVIAIITWHFPQILVFSNIDTVALITEMLRLEEQ